LGSFDVHSTGGQHSPSPLVAAVAQGDLAEHFTTFNTQYRYVHVLYPWSSGINSFLLMDFIGYLCYYSDVSMIGVHATVTGGAHQRELMRVMMRELNAFSHYVDPYLLEQAKNQLKMNTLATIDGTTVVSHLIHVTFHHSSIVYVSLKDVIILVLHLSCRVCDGGYGRYVRILVVKCYNMVVECIHLK
jgi:hypothetical protein